MAHETVELEHDTFVRVYSYLRGIANICKNCLRKSPGTCEQCNARQAEWLCDRLMQDNGGEAPAEKHSVIERAACVMEQLRAAKTSLSSLDIRLNCSKELKSWTFKWMIRRNMIARTKCYDGTYVYSIVEKTEKKEK